ncbi:MAG: 23S rRNA (guanine(2445)-N(2))/(guanine(2069)-N(7))-methyltransferase, partial [Desulfocapsa sp.]
AVSTMTVDMPQRFLSRARANLSLNGYGGPLHRFHEGDCLQWLKSSGERYGLIFINPPAFYRNRDNRTAFDLRQDHTILLQQAMNRLSRDGILIFSCNCGKFDLDPSLEQQYNITDISEQTIAHDCRRRARNHCCWQLHHFEKS